MSMALEWFISNQPEDRILISFDSQSLLSCIIIPYKTQNTECLSAYCLNNFKISYKLFTA